MYHKKNFRIKRTAKFEEMIAKSQVLKHNIEKITGGAQTNAAYNRFVGLILEAAKR